MPSGVSTLIVRGALALYGVRPGSDTLASVMAQTGMTDSGVVGLVNARYAVDLGAWPIDRVAEHVAQNLGLSGPLLGAATGHLRAWLANASPDARGQVLLDAAATLSGLTAHPDFGPHAAAFNERVAAAEARSRQPGSADEQVAVGRSFQLSAGDDSVLGSAGDDLILAGSGALGPVDRVDGGPGDDRFDLALGASTRDAVLPLLSSVETVRVRLPESSAGAQATVRLDGRAWQTPQAIELQGGAGRVLVQHLAPGGATEDFSIRLADTGPDANIEIQVDGLRNLGRHGSTLTLELINIPNLDWQMGNPPLLGKPYNGFSFQINGKTVELRDPPDSDPADLTTFTGALTYPQLLQAVQGLLTRADNLAAHPELARIRAALGPDFQVDDGFSTQVYTGQSVVLVGPDDPGFVIRKGEFLWTEDGFAMRRAEQTVIDASDSDLVTATVILGNVGRGETAGRLAVGGLDGEAGVERMRVTVEGSSAIASISALGGGLREVVVTGPDDGATLSVLGRDRQPTQPTRPDLPMARGDFGFVDVQVVDMSGMPADVAFDVILTNEMLKTSLGQGAVDARNVVPMRYLGGQGDDQLSVVIAPSLAGSPSHTLDDLQLRPSFLVDGGPGNDRIEVALAGEPGTEAAGPYASGVTTIESLRVSGGAGDDVVVGLGRGGARIDLGDGDDRLTVRLPEGIQGAATAHTIDGGRGDDLIELGLPSPPGEVWSRFEWDRDTIVFRTEFGHDTVLNFKPGRDGDRLSLNQVLGDRVLYPTVLDQWPQAGSYMGSFFSVTLAPFGSTHVSPKEVIDTLLVGEAPLPSSLAWLFIAYDPDNVGHVFKVQALGTPEGVRVTLAGLIDLGDTPWSTLTSDNLLGS